MALRRIPYISVIAVMTLLCQLPIAQAQQRAPKKKSIETLVGYRNIDLSCLDAESRKQVDRLISSLLPADKPINKSGLSLYRPWYFWELPSAGNRNLTILLEIPSIFTIPGQAVIRVNFFEGDGTRVATSLISLGWRIKPKDARLISTSALGYPMLEFSSEPMTNGREIDRQYFVIDGVNVFLVRLETAEGLILRNRYEAPNQTIGPFIPSRSVDEWVNALKSSNKARVLEALVWLGGIHSQVKSANTKKSGDLSWLQIDTEKESDAAMVSSLRSRSDVRGIIEELKSSESRWISEAATLALQPETDGQ